MSENFGSLVEIAVPLTKLTCRGVITETGAMHLDDIEGDTISLENSTREATWI